MDGIQLACRYSFKANALGYCGPENAHSVFLEYLQDTANDEKRKKAALSLGKFEAVKPYLREIAASNQMQPLDYEVVEAYWLGNKLLKSVPAENLKKIILTDFAKPGLLPREKAEKLAAGVPNGCMPHHSFHVLYLNTITGVIAKTLENADACRISWGKVVVMEDEAAEINENGKANRNLQGKTETRPQESKRGLPAMKAVVERRPLVLEGKRRALGPEKKAEIQTNPVFTPALKAGDTVSIHWGLACGIITPEQAGNLEKYTLKNLEAIESQKNLEGA